MSKRQRFITIQSHIHTTQVKLVKVRKLEMIIGEKNHFLPLVSLFEKKVPVFLGIFYCLTLLQVPLLMKKLLKTAAADSLII